MKKLFYKIFNSCLIYLTIIPILMFRVFKIRNNRILLSNFFGKGYGDSPKYIAEVLKSKKYELIWIYRGKNKPNLPKHIIPVKIYTLKYYYYVATAKFWILNTRTPIYFIKRRQQIYIQTWHGCLAFKKIEFDVEDKLSKNYIRHAKYDTSITDLMVSNSTFCDNMYRKAFKYNGKIIKAGTPRNDILVSCENNKYSDKIKKIYNIPRKNKILLYAPTFRKNNNKNAYDIDFDRLKESLNTTSYNKISILTRMHPGIKNPENLLKNTKDTINANDYDDIQELIAGSDIVITDYSSIMFEAMIGRKIVILYVNDIEEYNMDRGSYFNIKDLPFVICENNQQLANRAKNIDKLNYKQDYTKFEEKLGTIETGESSLAIKKYIDEIINNEQ